jgi:hypothetical protein
VGNNLNYNKLLNYENILSAVEKDTIYKDRLSEFTLIYLMYLQDTPQKAEKIYFRIHNITFDLDLLNRLNHSIQ